MLQTTVKDWLTVIIPVLNRRDSIVRCLESIASQGDEALQGVEVIVVDNGSTDGTQQAVVDTAARLKLRLRMLDEPVAGAANARNRGLQEVTTPYVMFFDSDDEMLPGHIESIHHAFATHPQVQLLTFAITNLTPTGPGNPPWQPDLRRHISYCTLSTQRMALTTDLCRSVGGWDGSLKGWDDYELGVRLLLANPAALALDAPSHVLMHYSEDSITGLQFATHPERWQEALDKITRLLQGHALSALPRGVWATLAARYRREEAADLSRDALHRALEGATMWQRTACRLIYHTVRITGHGGSFLTYHLL